MWLSGGSSEAAGDGGGWRPWVAGQLGNKYQGRNGLRFRERRRGCEWRRVSTVAVGTLRQHIFATPSPDD